MGYFNRDLDLHFLDYGRYPSISYQIGLYADNKGFACALVGLDEDEYMGFEAQIFYDRCSTKEIIKNIMEYQNKYRIGRININPLPSLKSDLEHVGLSVNVVNIEITDMIYRISSLITDDILQVKRELEDTFETDTSTFHPDIVSHRLNALALALADISQHRWLDRLLR